MERATYDRIRELQDSHWWFLGRRDVIAKVIARLGLPRDAKILEVGCGAGGNIPMLRQFGEVGAMEPDDDSRAYASQNLGMTVERGFLPDDLPFEPGTFDLVCAFDVIEHVDEDAASIKALSRLLRPGGVILTTVPAYAWLWSHHDEQHHHKRRYRLDRYKALFDLPDLKVETASYFNTILFPAAAAQRLAKRLTGDKSSDDATPPAPLNTALARLFKLEAPWLGAGLTLPFGVSIIVAARREARG